MKTTDMKDFANCIRMLAEVFDNGEAISELKLRIYWEVLRFYSIEDIKNAITKICASRKYNNFPKPAEIIDEINGSIEDQGKLAWHSVVQTIRRVGPYESVEFRDKAIMSAIMMMGGWEAINQMEEKEVRWKEKDFMSYYEICKKKSIDDHPQYLIGINERLNEKYGITNIRHVIDDINNRTERLQIKEA